jgi:hypothetical protein
LLGGFRKRASAEMIGFLRNRSLVAAGKKAAADALRDQSLRQAAEQPAPSPAPGEAQPTSPAPPDVPVTEATGPVADALATAAQPAPGRYEARENADGWSVHDRETGDTAEVYGYRLAKMNRSRAESLVEVLNRGEARRRGRNG